MNEKRVIKLSTHEYNYAKGKVLLNVEQYGMMVNGIPSVLDDIIISQKDFPNVKIGDVVEVYSIEDNYRFAP